MKLIDYLAGMQGPDVLLLLACILLLPLAFAVVSANMARTAERTRMKRELRRRRQINR